MVLNKQVKVAIDRDGVRAFVRKLRRALKLGRRDFNVCFVDDARMTELNGRYRKQPRPTDVLSFPWRTVARVYDPRRSRAYESRVMDPRSRGDHAGFLGDIVISVETARRNARAAPHPAAREIRWLILHGVLHLLGYDHETDQGEMTALELALREQLRA